MTVITQLRRGYFAKLDKSCGNSSRHGLRERPPASRALHCAQGVRGVSLSSAMRTILLCLQPAVGKGSRECKARDPEATTERRATATPVG